MFKIGNKKEFNNLCLSRNGNDVVYNVMSHLEHIPKSEFCNNIAAVTCFFNPQKSQRRIECLNTFASQFPKVGMDLFIIEGATGPHQLSGKNVMHIDYGNTFIFAKENLLNILITSLPSKYEYIMWIDADVLIYCENFAQKILQELKANHIIQPCKILVYLNKSNVLQKIFPSIAYINKENHSCTGIINSAFPGLAWAARRELLSLSGGLYDKAIAGGGDCAWSKIIYNDTNNNNARGWSDKMHEDVNNATKSLHCKVNPTVSYIDTVMYHLYHGERHNRQYTKRHEILKKVNYDPRKHVEYSSNGALRFTRHAPDIMIQRLTDYIFSRREDE